MGSDTPLVSIGLPVYNGAKYLRDSVDSILAQTFGDFELIVSDNASTDESAEICRAYAARDSRVRYHRNPNNIGGANNANLTFEMSRGKYFRWAAHDDTCAPELLAACVPVLEENPKYVVCYTQVVSIDEKGQRRGLTSRNNAASDKPWDRFAAIALSADFMEETYGLMRSDVLRTTRLLQNYTGSDRTLMCELALHGPFFEVSEPLFYKRFHEGNVYADWRARMAWFNPSLEGKLVFPFWVQFADFLRTIERVPVPPPVKLRCYASMTRWLQLHGKNMAKDVAVAAYMLLHSQEWRRKRHSQANNWS